MPAPLHVFFCLKFDEIIRKDFEGVSTSHYEFCAMQKSQLYFCLRSTRLI